MEKRMGNQQKEAVVMIGEEWKQLRFCAIEKGSLILTDKSVPDASDAVRYRESIDYEVDYETGQIRRLPQSVLPDFRINKAYGALPRSVNLDTIEDYSLYHCSNFSVYASYRYEAEKNDTYEDVLRKINQQNHINLPIKLAQIIKEKRSLIYGVVGDSISTGAEATKGNEYYALFAKYMEDFGIEVKICNVAIGGKDSTDAPQAIERLYQEKGIRPDLITIAYGMNDQNSLGNEPGVSTECYIDNLKEALKKIKVYGGGNPEVILMTAMPANPIWNFTSGGSVILAEVLRRYASIAGLPLADPNALFQSELAHGKSYEELITALINHPGDYGHYLYYLALKSVLEEVLGN